jgi:hypothetical protein
MNRKVEKRQTWPMAMIGTPDDIQFDPRAYMDPDTASAAIYNSDNTTTINTTAVARNHLQATPAVTPHSDTVTGGSVRSGNGNNSNSHKRASNSAAATMPLPHAKPKRRLTFGGLRSDTNGTKYMSQRKPSNPIVAAVSSVGKAVTGAVRRASLKITTANGQDVEIISESKTSTPRSGDKQKMFVNSSADSLAYDDVETHYHNRQRRVFEPQKAELLASAWWIRVCGVLNVICAVFYLQWRYVM